MNEDDQSQSTPPASPAPEPSPVESPAPQPMTPPAAPSQPQPVVVTSDQRGKKSALFKKPMVIAGIAVVIALLAGAGLVFGLYLPNTPDNVYSASLTNTGTAVDELIQYANQQSSVSYKSAAFDGTLNVKSPSGSFDASMNGSADMNANLTMTADADILGENITADVRSVHVSGDTTPDIYLRVGGVKSLLDANGLGSLDSLNNQWIAIDHTLLDTYAAALKKNVGTDLTSAGNMPTTAEVLDAATKVQAVNKTYLYTTDAQTAVLTNEKYIGQEVDGGRTLNHYTVGYSKAHLEAYVSALQTALDSSSLNTWSVKANSGKSLSELLDFSTLQSDVQSAKSDYTFDLWTDTGTKLVAKIQMTDPSDSSSVFTVSQGYIGSGSSYPFTISASDKDSSGNPENGSVGITVNTDTNKVSATFAFDDKATAGETTVSGALDETPSNSSISVTAPAGAKSIIDVLDQLGLGSLTKGKGL